MDAYDRIRAHDRIPLPDALDTPAERRAAARKAADAFDRKAAESTGTRRLLLHGAAWLVRYAARKL